MNGKERSGTSQLIRALLAIAIGLIIWYWPAPAGIKKEAMHLLAIFVATIVGLILTPLPMGAVVIIGVMLTGLTGTLKVGQILSGFANNTVWLIVAAFLLTRGFIKTGLGRRISFLFIRAFGRKTLGLAWLPALIVLVLVYFYSHYGFASVTAKVTAMFPPFLAIAMAAQAPPQLTLFLFGMASALGAGITHYGTGPSPIYYNAGYVDLGMWWKLGLLVSIINLVIWFGVGFPWWKVLGLW